MNLQGKKPVVSPTQIESIIKESQLKYRVGAPLSYRLSCASTGGSLNFEGLANGNLTEKDEKFSLCPIAFRTYKNRKFGREKSAFWSEVYFLNEKGQLGMVMFSTASAENLMNLNKLLFYEDLNLSQVKLNVSLKSKTNATAKSDYYMCQFTYNELTNEERVLQQIAVESLGEIFRSDILDNFDQMVDSLNYPQHIINCLSVYDPTSDFDNSTLLAEFEEIPSEAPQQALNAPIPPMPANTAAATRQGTTRR